MKQVFTFFIAMLVSFSLFSQVMLTEDFSGNLMPPAGWSVSSQASNWKIANSANAGGVAAEGKLTWSPQFNTMTRLISPALDLSGNTKAIVSFKQMIDHYSGNYQIGIATRASEADEWTDAWTQTVASSQAAHTRTVVIDNENVNSTTFQFCLFFNGSSYNINDWYFDDFELLVPLQFDMAVASIDVPPYFLGERTIGGNIVNNGLDPITSYDINWSLDDGAVNTTSYNGLNVTTGGTHTFSCAQLVNPDPGLHTLKVWLSNPNGQSGGDDNPDNDLIETEISIPTETLQRRPLFEEFTSSTCAPCYSFNNSVFNPFIAQNGENIALIKYQMNWPGAGDPYYTAEGGTRRNFYGVNAVPMLFAEGKGVATSAAAVNNAYNNAMADPAFVKIEGVHAVNGNDFTVTANVTSYADINDVNLYVVIVEEVTYNNVASNGETEFHNVMMKMMPGANGETMSFSANQTATITYTHDMSTTFVEEMDDLFAVIFIQDNSSKYVFQAANSVDESAAPASITFDPADGAVDFPTEADLHIDFSVPVYMVGGQDITNANVASLISLQEVDGDDFPFTATINDDKTQITVSPVGLLDKQTTYHFAVADVETASGTLTPGTSVTFTTGYHVGIQDQTARILTLAPNPVSENMVLKYAVNASGPVNIVLLDLNGREVAYLETANKTAGNYQLQFNVNSLPNGIYMLRLQSNQEIHTSKVIVTK